MREDEFYTISAIDFWCRDSEGNLLTVHDVGAVFSFIYGYEHSNHRILLEKLRNPNESNTQQVMIAFRDPSHQRFFEPLVEHVHVTCSDEGRVRYPAYPYRILANR